MLPLIYACAVVSLAHGLDSGSSRHILIERSWSTLRTVYIPTNLQINLCLRNVSNLLDFEYFCLNNYGACPLTMYGHNASQVSTKRFSGWIGSIFA